MRRIRTSVCDQRRHHRRLCFEEYNLHLSSSERNVSRSRWPADILAGRRTFCQYPKGFASPARRPPALRLDSPHPRTPRFGPRSLSSPPESLLRLVRPPARARLRKSLIRRHMPQRPRFGQNRVRNDMVAHASATAKRSTKAVTWLRGRAAPHRRLTSFDSG